jgi:hypothetical protein
MCTCSASHWTWEKYDVRWVGKVSPVSTNNQRNRKKWWFAAREESLPPTLCIQIFRLTILNIYKIRATQMHMMQKLKPRKIHKHEANECKPRALSSSRPYNTAVLRTTIKRIAYKPRRYRSKSCRGWVYPPKSPSLGTKETTPLTKSSTRTWFNRSSQSLKCSNHNEINGSFLKLALQDWSKGHLLVLLVMLLFVMKVMVSKTTRRNRREWRLKSSRVFYQSFYVLSYFSKKKKYLGSVRLTRLWQTLILLFSI